MNFFTIFNTYFVSFPLDETERVTINLPDNFLLLNQYRRIIGLLREAGTTLKIGRVPKKHGMSELLILRIYPKSRLKSTVNQIFKV